MPSLTRTEAVTRAQLLTVSAVEVDLDLTAETDTFPSTTRITFECVEEGAATFCDVKPVVLESAVLNGESVEITAWADGRLPLTGLRAGTNTLEIAATMAYANDGEGLHRHIAPDGRRYLYAMSFLDGGPKWFAGFDQPDLKAPYTLTVTAPADWVVRGNGPAEPVGGGLDTHDASAVVLDQRGVGQRTWRLHQPVPLATYFVTLVAGPYAEVRSEHDGVPLGICVRADLAEELAAQADDIFAVTAACLDAYQEMFGMRYPYGEYHQAFVPDFNAGAMENPGCVTFRDQYIFRGAATENERGGRACTIAHEMAHMWFGDLVTMRWWDDLWLNESFAEFMAHTVCSRVTPYQRWLEFGISRKDWGLVADQSSSTHPIAGNGSADAESALQQFDGISYAKGAAVLRQLSLYVGEETFLAGLREYFGRYGGGNAEFAELMACWRTAGATEIDGWAEEWLRTTGPDLLTGVSAEPGWARITRTSPDVSTPLDGRSADRAHITTAVRLDAAGRVVGESPVRIAAATTLADLPGDGGLVLPDGHDETWARVAPDWSSVPPIAAVADPRTRLVLYNALRDGVRSVQLDPARATALLAAALPSEPQVEFVEAMGGFLQKLAGPWCPPGQRADRARTVADTFGSLLRASEPGSDRQLAAFRLAIGAATDPDGLRRWLAGELPDGLSLDHVLRWAIAVRLVSLTGETSVIDDCLAADPSSAGVVAAARARAAVPTTAAKDAAFALLVDGRDVPAYELYATAEAFFLPHQHDLTAPYVARYFAEIDGTKAFRHGWALGRVALLAFPGTYADSTTVGLAEALAADPNTHQAVRRSVVDGLDQLRRAAASVERFG